MKNSFRKEYIINVENCFVWWKFQEVFGRLQSISKSIQVVETNSFQTTFILSTQKLAIINGIYST